MKANKVILMVVAALAGLVCMGVASALGFDVASSGVLGLAGVGMAANYVQEGDVLTLTAPYTVTSGQGAQIGSQFGVALADITNAVAGEFATSGVWDLTALSTATGAQGAKAYWDNNNKRVDTDGTVGILIGSLVTAKTNGQTTARVKLNEAVGDMSEGPQPAIAALTDNTGGSGTHDDTLADGLTVVAPAEITAYAAVVNMSEPVAKAEGEAVSAALKTLRDEVAALRIIVASCVTDLTAQNQNDSDVAQKILEIRTALIAAGIIAAA